MAKFHFDTLVLVTFQRLSGIASFLDVIDKATPAIEFDEREAIKRLAEQEQWDFGDYQIETQVIDERFGHWVPRFAAYSVIILLHSVVETQLSAFAARVGRDRNSTFKVTDIHGKGIEQAAVFLVRVSAINIKKDPTWQYLKDLEELRNVIVHRGGRWPKSPEDQRTKQLLQAYKGKLLLPQSSDWLYEEMWISTHLCSHFVREIEGFFRRIFKSAGLPSENLEIGE